MGTDRPGIIYAGITISALGALPYNLLPLFFETAQEFHELSDHQAGLLGSCFFIGFTLAMAGAHTWIRRINWRTTSFSAVSVAALALVATAMVDGFLPMALLMALAGGACSVLYGIGTTALGDTTQATRWYGLKIASEAALGALLLWVLPLTVTGRWGFAGLVVAMAVVLFALSPFLVRLPTSAVNKHTQHASPAVPLRLALWLALAGVMLYMLSITMVWTLIEHLAVDRGIDAITAAHVLSIGLLLAAAGSLAASWLGDRFGLAAPLGVSSILLLLSFVLLGRFESATGYTTASFLFTFAFGLGIPFMIAVVAKLDTDGRHVVLTVPAIGVGVMFAPAAGAYLAGLDGYTMLLTTAGVGAVLALLLAVLALRTKKRGTEPEETSAW